MSFGIRAYLNLVLCGNRRFASQVDEKLEALMNSVVFQGANAAGSLFVAKTTRHAAISSYFAQTEKSLWELEDFMLP